MTELAPIEEDITPADAWAEGVNEPDKKSGVKINQANLEWLEIEFLANGGEIQIIPPGVSGSPDVHFNSTAAPSKNPDKFSNSRKAHEDSRARRYYSKDDELVELITQALPSAELKQDLAKACKCSDDKVQRLLRTYFIGNPAAQPFMRKSPSL